MAAALAIHGHFYQPPRENPWTGQIDKQPSAAPFHDWNERVHAECYRPNTSAVVPTPMGELTVNNFERLSFDVGPTLMSWLEHAHPDTYAKIIEADRRSVARLGHGNAIAQGYHHAILPLSSPRNARTEVRWGLADFRNRFGRHAEGMWLPETAANLETLDILIDEGVGFTILAPGQASETKAPNGDWTPIGNEGIDPRVPYRYPHRDGSGRSLAIYFYDGDIAHAIAFESAAASADRLAEMFERRARSEDDLIHVATDGETYGHHFRFGDLGLSYLLFIEAEKRNLAVTNYAAHLAEHPSGQEVRIRGDDGSSWSCPHGVGRWTRDCGCSTGGREGWKQAWRLPLREALDVLRIAADEVYERLGGRLLNDPWGARDRYVEVVSRHVPFEVFAAAEAQGPLDEEGRRQIATLLEMQRSVLAMFTSCGWFFADVAGIETEQILRYAARTLELMEDLSQPVPADAFFSKLSEAKSNDPAAGTAVDVFHRASADFGQHPGRI